MRRTLSLTAMGLLALLCAPSELSAGGPRDNTISDVWTHAGETSAVISCTTSSRSRVHVEYGPTPQYGSTSEPEERIGWLHLARLRGLEPGTTYHFRIVAVAKGKAAARSDAMTLRPARIAGAVRIPHDLPGPPYVLDKANTTYVLTDNIVTDGTAFKITASGVRLELDGHTVRYGRDLNWTDPGQKHAWHGTGHGIYLPGWGAKNVVVVNGVLHEATPKKQASPQGFGHNPVMAEGSTGLELAGITAVYSGKDIRGFWLHNSKSAGVHHCIIEDRGTEVTNRHQGLDGIVATRGSKVHHNLIRRVRHRGINAANDCTIRHNEIHVDSYATNAYGIMFYRCRSASAHHNYVLGGGYHVIGIGTVSRCSGVKVFDNYIKLAGTEPTDRWAEYGKMSGMNGVRATWGGENLEYYNNTIIVTGRGGSKLRGTWFYSDDKLRNLVFRDNIVRVIAADQKTRAWAIAVCGSYKVREHHPVLYRNNTIVSNVCNVRLGESYGLGSNARFIANTFVREGEDPRYATVRIGYWSKPTVGHVFLDSRFEGGASFESVRFEAAGPREFAVQWFLDLKVRDANKGPLPGAKVAIADRTGAEAFTGEADAKGSLRAALTQYVHAAEGKRLLTPHTVRVTRAGFKPAAKTVTIEGTTSLEVVLQRQ